MNHSNRESWLIAAVEQLRPLFLGLGHTIPAVKVSTGFPSTGGLSRKRQTIGQCWDAECSADKAAQIFISPMLEVLVGHENLGGVLDTLAHELIHAVFGAKEKHGKKFAQLAAGIGLAGSPKSGYPDEGLTDRLNQMAATLGPYPHCGLTPAEKEKKQGTRMIKCECEACGYTVRTTKKWIEVGPPGCPAHGPMKVELPEEPKL